MKRQVAVLVGMLVASTATNVVAAPPLVRPIGLTTVYGLSEGARRIERSLDHRKKPAHPMHIHTIVLDPGHGGSNLGALGVADIREKYLTLELAYMVRDALVKRHPDLRVLMTRYWDRDVDLYERTRWAHEMHADMFVSLHYNAALNDQATGFETYFLDEDVMAVDDKIGSRKHQKGTRTERRAWRAIDRARRKALTAARKPLEKPFEKSKQLAALIDHQLARHLDSPNRGVKEGNYAVLRGAFMPAVVVESGFLTNADEGMAITTTANRKKIVAALVAAIEAYDARQKPPGDTAMVQVTPR